MRQFAERLSGRLWFSTPPTDQQVHSNLSLNRYHNHLPSQHARHQVIPEFSFLGVASRLQHGLRTSPIDKSPTGFHDHKCAALVSTPIITLTFTPLCFSVLLRQFIYFLLTASRTHTAQRASSFWPWLQQCSLLCVLINLAVVSRLLTY